MIDNQIGKSDQVGVDNLTDFHRLNCIVDTTVVVMTDTDRLNELAVARLPIVDTFMFVELSNFDSK